MEQDESKRVGICGIYCGTCPRYLANRLKDTEEMEKIHKETGVPSDQIRCDGCLSDTVFPTCEVCKHGFRQCAAEKKISWCFQCDAFPCQRLRDFRDIHIVNGISHHEHVIEDLEYMREKGLEQWVAEQEAKARCPECGMSIYWHARECPNCHERVRKGTWIPEERRQTTENRRPQ
ncbi:MAG: DUF3795 domain-containing protein [Deltaproteobacteria bacterium]|nr:MAG: DUF3795 domain-containing protein [Deltaproteobacteria bacterium]